MTDTEPKCETGHTPGPWRATGATIGTEADEIVATIRRLRNRSAETYEADARLVAAAPKLLLTCRGTSDICGNIIDNIKASEAEGFTRGTMLDLLSATVTLLKDIVEDANDAIAAAEPNSPPENNDHSAG